MTKTNKEEEKEKLRQELGRPLTVAEAGEVNLKYDVKKNKQPRGASVGYRNLMNKMDRYYNGGEAELYDGNEKLTDLNLSEPEKIVKEDNFNLKISFKCPRCNSKNVYINAKTKEVVYCSDCKYFDRESQGRVFKFEKEGI